MSTQYSINNIKSCGVVTSYPQQIGNLNRIPDSISCKEGDLKNLAVSNPKQTRLFFKLKKTSYIKLNISVLNQISSFEGFKYLKEKYSKIQKLADKYEKLINNSKTKDKKTKYKNEFRKLVIQEITLPQKERAGVKFLYSKDGKPFYDANDGYDNRLNTNLYKSLSDSHSAYQEFAKYFSKEANDNFDKVNELLEKATKEKISLLKDLDFTKDLYSAIQNLINSLSLNRKTLLNGAAVHKFEMHPVIKKLFPLFLDRFSSKVDENGIYYKNVFGDLLDGYTFSSSYVTPQSIDDVEDKAIHFLPVVGQLMFDAPFTFLKGDGVVKGHPGLFFFALGVLQGKIQTAEQAEYFIEYIKNEEKKRLLKRI